MILLLINQILCFSAHFIRNPWPRYLTIENIIEYFLQMTKSKKRKSNTSEVLHKTVTSSIQYITGEKMLTEYVIKTKKQKNHIVRYQKRNCSEYVIKKRTAHRISTVSDKSIKVSELQILNYAYQVLHTFFDKRRSSLNWLKC